MELVAGLLTIVLGAIVLAGPGPTILVASTLFGVYLLLSHPNHPSIPNPQSRQHRTHTIDDMSHHLTTR